MAEPKYSISPKLKGAYLPKPKRSTFNDAESPDRNPQTSTIRSNSRGCITNEKIRYIIQDSKNFNERIKSFGGTSHRDMEYVDIEDALYLNLNALVEIHTDNVKLQQQKLDAILIVQEQIKQLDITLLENIGKAKKRIGYSSDKFVAEGKSKTKSAQKSDNPNNKHRLPHSPVTKRSPPASLVDEIIKIKSNLKTAEQKRKINSSRNPIQQNATVEKEAAERSVKVIGEKESVEPQGSKKSTILPLRDKISKIKYNLQCPEKCKAYRKPQSYKNLLLLEIPEETEEANSLTSVDQHQPDAKVLVSELPIETKTTEIEPQHDGIDMQQGQLKKNSELIKISTKKAEIETAVNVKPEKYDATSKANNADFCSSLEENRIFKLERKRTNLPLFKKGKLKVTNTFKTIHNCLQQAQHKFECLKSGHNHHEANYLAGQYLIDEQGQSHTALEPTQLMRQITDIDANVINRANGEGETAQDQSDENQRISKENIVQVVQSYSVFTFNNSTYMEKISILLVQIRLLLLLTVMRVLQLPYQILAPVLVGLWLWER